MRTPARPPRLLLVAAAVLFLALPARAEEALEPPPPGSPVTDAEARDLLRALTRVAKKKEAAPILEALDAIGLRSHEDFHKPLLKLLTHDRVAVAVRAAEILAVQEVEKERLREKLAKSVWKEGWRDRANEQRLAVRGAALVAVASLEKKPLDEDRFEEVEGLWRRALEDPRSEWGVGLVPICTYVEITNDKRMCRWFGEEIDLPEPENVDDPANPPAEWWKRRWELHKEIKDAAVDALEVLTGQRFKSTQEAQAWFESHVEDFGFRW